MNELFLGCRVHRSMVNVGGRVAYWTLADAGIEPGREVTMSDISLVLPLDPDGDRTELLEFLTTHEQCTLRYGDDEFLYEADLADTWPYWSELGGNPTPLALVESGFRRWEDACAYIEQMEPDTQPWWYRYADFREQGRAAFCIILATNDP